MRARARDAHRRSACTQNPRLDRARAEKLRRRPRVGGQKCFSVFLKKMVRHNRPRIAKPFLQKRQIHGKRLAEKRNFLDRNCFCVGNQRLKRKSVNFRRSRFFRPRLMHRLQKLLAV